LQEAAEAHGAAEEMGMMCVPHQERRVGKAVTALAVALFVNLLLTPVVLLERSIGPAQASDQGTNTLASSTLWTKPADGETNVSLDQQIIILFSDPVNMTVTPLFNLTPDASPYSYVWSPDETNVTWDHARLFEACARHDARVEWVNSTGDMNTYNWTFWTTCFPSISDTYPFPHQIDTDFFTPIFVNFSVPMDNTSLTYEVLPPGIAFTEDWLSGDRTVILNHTVPFNELTVYTVNITSARSKSGDPLVRGSWPNPWNFSTTCYCAYIIDTEPSDGARIVSLQVHIFVNFSNPVDPATFFFVLNPPPLAPPTTLWYNGNRTVEIVVRLRECTTYVAFVTVQDIFGKGLLPGPVPNPWSFTTACPCHIEATTPSNGTVDVPLNSDIFVFFSQPVIPSSFVFNLTPEAGPLNYTWYNGNQTVKIAHAASFDEGTLYTAQVLQVRDIDGNSLSPGPVANPWTFTSEYLTPYPGGPGGLQVHRMPPDDVKLAWDGVSGATHYRVYHSTDRFAPWPWAVIADVATNETTVVDHLSDMQNHFYIVRGVRPAGETLNSTMGVLWHADVTYVQNGANVFWVGLPYNTIYRSASDISDELTSSKIVALTKWDPATQKSVPWFFLRGKWRGTNFAINPGDGLWFGVASSFDWAVNGTDFSTQLNLTYRPSLGDNYYWPTPPYTGRYAKASALVLSIAGGLGPGNDTMIDAVIKWDYSSGTSLVYRCTATGWEGVDFDIMPGDSVRIRVTSDFVWIPELLAPEAP